ncbi:MAG: transaldolase family protein [Kiritimatiellae bacterium]|nr:transaldolase family protein [Kiritimatiellia bacterium]
MSAEVADSLREWILDRAAELGAPAVAAPAAHAGWAAVRATGTRLWLDTGDLEAARALWTAEFEALTTNNTLLNAEVQKGQYDGLVRAAAARLRELTPTISADELRLEIAFVLNAVHGLRLVRAFGARVSVELHTDLANDVERSVQYGRRYHAISPDRFIVKVPLTPAGYLAARRLVRAGVPVNFTLGFSARQNLLAAALAQPDYVNVFMGRLNAFVVDHRLGDGRNVGERATLATQRGLRAWRARGATRTLLIGASMRDADQIVTLAGVDVFTLPPKVAAAYAARPSAPLQARLDAELPVHWADGLSERAVGAHVLWEVSERDRALARRAAAELHDRSRPEELVALVRREGIHDLFPDWTAEEWAAIRAEGKIPSWSRWREALGAGRVGLDALMNAAGLMSFVEDQAALDRRVMSLI